MEKKEHENFLNIQHILKELNKHLIVVFKDKYKIFYKSEWNDFNLNGQNLINSHKNQYKFSKIQEGIVKQGKSSEFDLSILIQILNFKEFYDCKLESFLEQVRIIRNSQAHNVDLKISEDFYKNYITQLTEFINYLGLNIEEIKKNQNYVEEKERDSSDKNFKSDISKEFIDLKNEGNKKFQEHAYSKAIEFYSKALLIEGLSEKDKAILYSNKANSYYELNQKSNNSEDLDESLKNAKISIYINPENLKCYYRIGKIYEKKDKLDKALINYKKCYTLSPDNDDVKNSIAGIKFKLFERGRDSSLFSDSFPTTKEEENDKISEHMRIRYGCQKLQIDKLKEFYFRNIPGFEEVCKGHDYRDGLEGKQDYEMAAKYYSKGMKFHNAEAAFNLARLYETGKGVKQNFQTAMSFLEIAANSKPYNDELKMHVVGVAEAQHSLGIKYQEGIFLGKNKELAIKWYEKAIKNGNHSSANNLGLILMDGDYAMEGIRKAEKLFLFSYSKSNQQALPNLVDVYIELAFPEQALMWHKRAIEKQCLFSISRDKAILKLIDSKIILFETTNIPKWEVEMKLDNKMSQIDRFIRFKKKTGTFNNKSEKKFEPDFFRIEMILEHRRSIINMKKINMNTNTIISHNYTPPTKSISENNNNLKKVFFRDIDSNIDYILKGFYLNVLLMDIPKISANPKDGILIIIQDENKDILRLSIYNLGRDLDLLNSKFGFGSRLRINNPYHRLAADGKPMIRVDDPKSIEIFEYSPKCCRTCGQDDCKLYCSKCKTAYYCSKECQLNDWNILEHRLICSLN